MGTSPAFMAFMRTLAMLRPITTIALFAFLAGCTAETAPPTKVRKGNTTQAPGKDNTAGEHGTNAPAGPQEVPEEGTPVGNETWADGKTIAENVTISAGSTVEIAPGAKINVGNNVSITVKGTLKVASAATHAKLTGQTWGGVVIAEGGTLTADGLDFENAGSAIWTQKGNLDATLTNGVIKGETPFKMEAGSKLSVSKTNITSTGGSAIAGTFTASHITYNKSGGGISISDPAAVVTISDSTLKGASNTDSDFVVSSGAKTIKIEYSEISQTHCALHFNAVDQFTIDHVSLVANTYGAMLYGSGAGPHSITASNVQNNPTGLDMQGTNGPLTVTGSFTSNNKLATNATETNKATANIADAKPRP